MITYNESTFLMQETLTKEITFPRKVKSKSIFIMGLNLENNRW